jgi:hypothetical protein
MNQTPKTVASIVLGSLKRPKQQGQLALALKII